jgi:hypothetical protein
MSRTLPPRRCRLTTAVIRLASPSSPLQTPVAGPAATGGDAMPPEPAAGALFYHRRWPDPSPAVFGYHEVFHACVCAAATCQYISITLITARISS